MSQLLPAAEDKSAYVGINVPDHLNSTFSSRIADSDFFMSLKNAFIYLAEANHVSDTYSIQ